MYRLLKSWLIEAWVVRLVPPPTVQRTRIFCLGTGLRIRSEVEMLSRWEVGPGGMNMLGRGSKQRRSQLLAQALVNRGGIQTRKITGLRAFRRRQKTSSLPLSDVHVGRINDRTDQGMDCRLIQHHGSDGWSSQSVRTPFKQITYIPSSSAGER